MSGQNTIQQEDRVVLAFQEVRRRFGALDDTEIKLIHKEIPRSSMRAQPEIGLNFFSTGKRAYKIEVAIVSKIDDVSLMNDLPHEVLVGWLAHELGHICDYKSRSWWDMIRFGVLYTTSPSFIKNAERRADKFAIANGFIKDILTTKKYMMSHSNLSPRYRKQLERYYYSPEQIEELIQTTD